jgi:IclR family transcriptional regulator, KDG regulon repressor
VATSINSSSASREPTGTETLNSATSVSKALSLLDCFRLKDVPMGVTELARQTGLPKSTAFRLLSHLEEIGYVERHGKQYRPGWLLFELGTGFDAVQPRGLRSAALPHMADLFALTRQTVHLGVLQKNEIIHVARMRGSESAVSPIRYGGRGPATCSAMGKVILAHRNSADVSKVVRGDLPRMTKYSITAPGLIVAQLRQARELGYAVEREETGVGLVSVAVPLRYNGKVIAALALAGRTGAFKFEPYVDPLRRSADLIAKSLREMH